MRNEICDMRYASGGRILNRTSHITHRTSQIANHKSHIANLAYESYRHHKQITIDAIYLRIVTTA